jgi:hypothetical protein
MRDRLLLLLHAALAAGCGGRVHLPSGDAGVAVPGPVPEPVAVYVAEPGCGEERAIETAEEALSTEESGTIAVVELSFAEECTGAGGQYILARDVDGSREFWIGGHACYFLSSGPGQPPAWAPAFGVLRYEQTAGLFQISPDVCVGFPGQPPGATTDAQTRAIAVFATLEEARAFAAFLHDD